MINGDERKHAVLFSGERKGAPSSELIAEFALEPTDYVIESGRDGPARFVKPCEGYFACGCGVLVTIEGGSQCVGYYLLDFMFGSIQVNFRKAH